ncbi:uncharacterized protein I206_107739 [Kwoniella pini CBS 10737]|uniref:Inactive metallocarboxypeptidase ECM14 n=1 Tax=Kwoniella pini CBS 10737 TaxID=1296096 RepID=A0A1B9HY49_9TREE|nr:uncharacterized protein I206_06073 [Kwoniella pini CBS 10737]OCF48205.1 hypothetical protein I206_06073 [Kwoniella pini CBS 10737]
MRAQALVLAILSLATPTIASIDKPYNSQQPFTSTNSGIVGQGDRYDDQQVWRIDWSDYSDVNKQDIMNVIELLNLDVWHSTQSSLDVRLSAKEKDIMGNIIPSESFHPFISDLQSLVEESLNPGEENPEDIDEKFSEISEGLRKKKKNKGKKGKNPKPSIPPIQIDPFNLTTIDTPFHDKFHTLKEIDKFGRTLIETFNGTRGIEITELNLGKTFEGRIIKGWSVKMNPNGNGSIPNPQPIPEPDPNDPEPDPRPLPDDPDHDDPATPAFEKRLWKSDDDLDGMELEFVIQAGQHGREWVGPSSALYFLHHLLLRATTEPNSDPAILLKSFRFTVIPQINPDGYEYSRTKSRLWRKNRQDVGGKGNCLGIDLNSNWGYKWRASKSTACSEGYGGKEAFEAYETKAISEYLSSAAERGNRVRAFVDLHSYGQLFMFPFAHSCDDFPPDAEMLMEAGLGVAKAMRTKQGEGYEAGQACDLTYRAPGDAIDYTYGITDVRWSYSAELRDTGTYGFMLPPKLIRPTADELTAGLMYLAKFIYALEVNPP